MAFIFGKGVEKYIRVRTFKDGDQSLSGPYTALQWQKMGVDMSNGEAKFYVFELDNMQEVDMHIIVQKVN